MKRIKQLLISTLLLITCLSGMEAQKVVFLHHSTGCNLYYQGNVAEWISDYNTEHGTNYLISERSYPNSPYSWDNYPFDYWNLWVNNQCNNAYPGTECLDKITQNYDIIVFKHCFPGAYISADDANPSVSSNAQTLANYKLQYRALRTLMDSYPGKKFIVWTLAPLHRLATSSAEAARARQFVDWVKTSWLSEDGKQHSNIYIFDFFGYAAENNPAALNGKLNCLKYDYENDHLGSDSHPNELANQTIGPLFAQLIINVASIQTDSCAEDIDGSGSVNTDDLLRLLSRFGTSCTAGCSEDIDRNTIINTDDLLRFLTKYGFTCQ